MSIGWTYLVAKGAFPCISTYSYIGRNKNVTTITDPEDIWIYGGLYSYDSFDATGEGIGLTLYASSTDNGDNQTLIVFGLDENWYEQVVPITLTGQTQAALSGQWKRINRIVNLNGTATLGDVYIAEADDLTGGIPDTASKVKEIMLAVDQVSTSARYCVPANKQAYLVDVWGSIVVSVGTPTNKAAELGTFIRLQGGVFLNGGTIGVMTNGIPIWNYHPKLVVDILPPKTDIIGRVISVTEDCDISAGYELILETC